MNSLSFNKSKVTRSLILIFFIYNLKFYNKNNISPEIYLALSEKGEHSVPSINSILTNF